MRVLVTGGAGYIGSKLVPRLLNSNYQVRVLDSLCPDSLSELLGNSSFEFLHGDIRDKDIVSASLDSSDVVIHLAAIVPGEKKPPDELIYEVNYDATRLIVDFCRDKKVRRFIFVSSCGNYGMTDTSRFAREDDPLNPTSPYAESKVKAEQYVLSSTNEHFCTTVLRLATVFGWAPNMNFSSMINAFVRDAFAKKTLIVYGSSSWRPFVHIDDVVEALLLVLRAPPSSVHGEVFNVGSNSLNYQKIQVIRLIKKHFPQASIQLRGDITDPRSYRVSFDKINKILGFQAGKDIDDGIEEMKHALEKTERMDGIGANNS